MLGIIGAMDVEVAALKNIVENKVVTTFAGIEFVCGKIADTDVCVAQCSPGKVNAALCTQMMIDKFDIDSIINIGIACSLNENVVIKDVVVASEVCQYDFDTSAVDGVKGLIFDGVTSFATDSDISNSLIDSVLACKYRCHHDIIASGDTFIASQELKDEIVSDFGAVCGEMEGGAIGQVCYVNKIPFAVLRTISDGGDKNVQIDYPAFKHIAAKISSDIILNYLRRNKN
ncbi:MAG: 5'-methylthioadenosine/adenosylhomocysteine nucleosidase [Eubacterium sp.]|nr:5'-methylthioadenosine/adenosylhomocysteine nucleosidase [Eubacterium sp.]MBR2278479.1 5'-methylthioadenosine/adenosylhomocysteine nucleosidase [Eubacterium sp.]